MPGKLFHGESLTGFFRTVQKVEVHDGGLLLFLKDEFYAKWASEWENCLALQNVILSYGGGARGFPSGNTGHLPEPTRKDS